MYMYLLYMHMYTFICIQFACFCCLFFLHWCYLEFQIAVLLPFLYSSIKKKSSINFYAYFTAEKDWDDMKHMPEFSQLVKDFGRQKSSLVLSCIHVAYVCVVFTVVQLHVCTCTCCFWNA